MKYNVKEIIKILYLIIVRYHKVLKCGKLKILKLSLIFRIVTLNISNLRRRMKPINIVLNVQISIFQYII